MLALKDGCAVFSQDKSSPRHFPARWIMQAVEESLTRLKTDYVDLYQVQRSRSRNTAQKKPCVRSMIWCAKGKVRALGEAATFATAGDVERFSSHCRR